MSPLTTWDRYRNCLYVVEGLSLAANDNHNTGLFSDGAGRPYDELFSAGNA